MGGREFRFLICSQMAGRAAGVYEATDPVDIQLLDDAVRARRGIKEIGAEEFAELKKKVTRTPQSLKSGAFRPKPVPSIPPMELAVEKAGVAFAAGSSPKGASPNNEEQLAVGAPPVRDLIREQRVNPPKPFAAADEKAVKSAQRAERKRAKANPDPAEGLSD